MENMVRLTGIVEPEDGMFAAYCSELGTATCGDTLEEAFANLEEAIEAHLGALADIGTLQQEFQERGIEVFQRSTRPEPEFESPMRKIFHCPVPLAASVAIRGQDTHGSRGSG